jgi:hypothetical protein
MALDSGQAFFFSDEGVDIGDGVFHNATSTFSSVDPSMRMPLDLSLCRPDRRHFHQAAGFAPLL